jgi:IS1 family transposase
MADERPKTAYELAMERLAKKDRETGAESWPLTEEQKTAVAEARQVYQARVAEREILHRSALAKAASAEEVEGLNLALRRDLARLATDRDRKIAQVRGEQPPAQAE